MSRRPGLSAMLRVKNEGEWLAASLESIIPWCDEIVICTQPSEDETLGIASVYAERNKHITVHNYPFDSWPNGPGYRDQNPNHPESRTYFYNWALEKTTRSHVIKWDGDMVAQDWLGVAIHELLEHGEHNIRLRGLNLSDVWPRMMLSKYPLCPTDGVFLVTDATRFVNGPCSERLIGTGPGRVITDAFLHFKWCKASARQAWPEDWQEIEHFRAIDKRAGIGAPYTGAIPTALSLVSALEAVR